MRYYDLKLIDPHGRIAFRATSHPNGKFDPGALQIEFDAPVATFGAPIGGQTISLHGVPLPFLSQARQFGLELDDAGKTIQAPYTVELLGGMSAGLPLAKPLQAGLLVAGTVLQSWGNWEGTEMTLELLVVAGGGHSMERPANIVLNWRAGMSLGDALKSCLSIAFPGVPVQVSVEPNLALSYDNPAFFATLEQLAIWVEQFTQAQFGSTVRIAQQGAVISVFDSSYKPPLVQLAFTDFVGQPTWVRPRTMQAKLVLRGDLTLGSLVKLPANFLDAAGITVTAPNSFAQQAKSKLTFDGPWQVIALRHIGQSRSPDGASWVTVIEVLPAGN